jgi:excisionase family DNA binding protein
MKWIILLISFYPSIFYISAQKPLEALHSTRITVTLINSKTGKPIQQEEGVVCRFTFSQFQIYYDRSQQPLFLGPTINYFHVKIIPTDGQVIIDDGMFKITRNNLISFRLAISGPGYEPQIIEQDVCQPFTDGYNFTFKSSYPSDCYQEIRNDILQRCPNNVLTDLYGFGSTIYLVPKSLTVNGTLNVDIESDNQESEYINTKVRSEKGLGDIVLFTTSEVAQRLRISEDAVLKLIKKGEIKAKNIDNKYFVRKEDLLEYLRK